jgi:hypothetical protein
MSIDALSTTGGVIVVAPTPVQEKPLASARSPNEAEVYRLASQDNYVEFENLHVPSTWATIYVRSAG